MARKNLLEGLMNATNNIVTDQPLDPERPRFSKGAIGAISRSVADLQSRALIEIDPNLIHAGGLADRLEVDPDQDLALRDSIAEYGQQVPVLVRPHPETAGHYQIVYGRRRVLALRDLGKPVKALVRQLDDRDLVLAQGQENTARRDLSFIEKANFARQMSALGYDRKVIGDTLSMDKTLISRLLSVMDRVPEELIMVIGAAPSVGRDRWLSLADALDASRLSVEDIIGLVNLCADNSDARFDVALRSAKGVRPSSVRAEVITSVNGIPLAQVSRTGGRLTLRFEKRADKGFEDWILANLADLHANFQRKS